MTRKTVARKNKVGKPAKTRAKPRTRKRHEKQSIKNPIRSRPTQLANSNQIVTSDCEDVTQVVEFLELFRELSNPLTHKPARLISIKIPEQLLATFRFKAERENKKYQSKIKELMLDYVKGS
jgi:uncharacterized protein (DUF4415 family)